MCDARRCFEEMCIISPYLAEEDTVYSVLLIIISMIVEFSKHCYKHICICNTDFGICNPNILIFSSLQSSGNATPLQNVRGKRIKNGERERERERERTNS
jgi:hypothetical protein